VIKAYAQCRDYPNAVKVQIRMRKRGLEPNAITYNSLIHAAARTGDAVAAWEFYQDMVTYGFRGDKYTCSILIKTLSPIPTGNRIRKCLDLLREVGTTCDLKLRTRLYHHVLDAALQLGDSAVLIRSFSQTRQHRVRPTAASCRQLKELADQCTGPSHKALEAAVGDEDASLGFELEEKHARGHKAPSAAHDHDEAKVGKVSIEPRALVKPQAAQWRPRCSMSEESNRLKNKGVLGGHAASEKLRPSPAMQWHPRRV